MRFQALPFLLVQKLRHCGCLVQNFREIHEMLCLKLSVLVNFINFDIHELRSGAFASLAALAGQQCSFVFGRLV